MLETEEPLNAQDIEKLNSRKRFLIFTYLLGLVFIDGFAFFVIYVLVEGSLVIYVSVLVVSLISFAFSYLFFKEYNQFNQNIRDCKKTVIRGIVTQKPVEGDDSDIYYLVIDTVKVFVREKVYDKYKIGDGIEIHIFKPRQSMLLYETKLEGTGLNDIKAN